MVRSILTLVCFVAMTATVQADPFQYQFSDSFAGSAEWFYQNPPPPGVTDYIETITVTLDNGGSSAASQVWTPADLQSISFDFYNGDHVVTFYKPFGGDGLTTAIGQFASNSAGVLTSVPPRWEDIGVTSDFVTDNAGIKYTWKLGEGYFQESDGFFDGSANLSPYPPNNESRDSDPAYWHSLAVPEPQNWAMMMVGVAAIAAFVSVARRANKNS